MLDIKYPRVDTGPFSFGHKNGDLHRHLENLRTMHRNFHRVWGEGDYVSLPDSALEQWYRDLFKSIDYIYGG